MKINIERPVTVITPSVGSNKLVDAIKSVASQTYGNINHLIVVDGEQYTHKVNKLILEETGFLVTQKMKVMFLPWNTGANGINGQRIYAAVPHLINSDYVFFLDDDNWYEPDHVKSLVNLIETEKLDWAHSFRKIYTADKQFIADDNCESLGQWPIYNTYDNPQYLVDTSAYAFTRKFIQATCHIWNSNQFACDRVFFYSVSQRSKWNTSTNHSLCYRVDSGPMSVGADFFIEGNKRQLEHYEGKLPWLKT